MALPALPEGFRFRVQSFDASRAAGIPATGSRAAIQLSIESVDGTETVQYLDTTAVKNEAQLVTLVESAATTMAQDFIRARDLQTWVGNNWPAS